MLLLEVPPVPRECTLLYTLVFTYAYMFVPKYLLLIYYTKKIVMISFLSAQEAGFYYQTVCISSCKEKYYDIDLLL